MDIKTAREMLAAATGEVKSQDEAGNWRDSIEVGNEVLAGLAARGQIERQASATLAAYILAVETLETSRNKFLHAANYLIRNHPADKDDALLARALRQDAREIDKAFAAWEKL